MKGTMLIVSPTGGIKTVPLTAPPTLERLQEELGGGYIEQVPLLKTIEYNGTIHPCVAFCDDEGKHKLLPRNEPANRLWDAALGRAGAPDARRRVGAMTRAIGGQPRLEEDFLCGKIIVIFGDRELMGAL